MTLDFMTSRWAVDASFYHLYPLGCLGSERRNPFTSEVSGRLLELHSWIDYLEELGVDTLLLGPVMQSSGHGYDVSNYFEVDRRLGSNEDLREFSQALHGRGMRLVLDAVFHHTGRDFWAFDDVLRNEQASLYRDWYHLDFSRRSPYGDNFYYEGWAGHYDLVKLNLEHPPVREHLLAAVSFWMDTFGIDGLRLDAADRLEPGFRREVSAHCRSKQPDFWLMGEVVHGDYRNWAHADGLCSVTNYEAYKSLWSGHNDVNYFEVAHSLQRQSGHEGIYRSLHLYNFADNHDVDRVASKLKRSEHLYPLYLLLLTIPGIPSLYYGSEWGIEGERCATSDAGLRPMLSPASMRRDAPHPGLYEMIRRLFAIRRRYESLRTGSYTTLHVDHEQFAFLRGAARQGAMIVVVNASAKRVDLKLKLTGGGNGLLVDVLNEDESFAMERGSCVLPLFPHWGRILHWT